MLRLFHTTGEDGENGHLLCWDIVDKMSYQTPRKGKTLFFYQIQVDRVTEEQIANARKIIPSLEIHPITALEDAFRVACEKVNTKIERHEFLLQREILVTVPASENRPAGKIHHFAQENENGWHFELAVFGD